MLKTELELFWTTWFLKIKYVLILRIASLSLDTDLFPAVSENILPVKESGRI